MQDFEDREAKLNWKIIFPVSEHDIEGKHDQTSNSSEVLHYGLIELYEANEEKIDT